ncbi:hypothetical protein [Spirosoma fluminis]
MTSPQVEQLLLELKKGAQAHGFAGDIWTRTRVNEVIKNRTTEAAI